MFYSGIALMCRAFDSSPLKTFVSISRFPLKIMSSGSYAMLDNPSNKLDVNIPVKESGTSAAMTASNEALKKRYAQIAVAVTLYW